MICAEIIHTKSINRKSQHTNWEKIYLNSIKKILKYWLLCALIDYKDDFVVDYWRMKRSICI